jgi:hypothetical protein
LQFQASPGKKSLPDTISIEKAGHGGTHLSFQQWQETKNRMIMKNKSLSPK